MADFDALDGRLRDALAQAAQQGDSAGVADAIRARVAAGDSGTSAAGSTAPGWGGGAWSWMPWLATVLVAGIVGTTLGLTGAFGVPVEEVSVLPSTASVTEVAPAYSCPGGPQVGELRGGDRVVAVQRSDDDAYLGVRDPWNVTTTLWVASSVVVVDAGQPAISTLPVGACPEVTVQYGDPTPTAEPSEEPVPQPPAPTPDTTNPAVNQIGASDSSIWNCSPDNQVTISVVASDNVGVTRVDLAWSGGTPSGSAQMSASGGTWAYTFVSPPYPTYGNVTFSATARDAAGNVSGGKSVVVFINDCPI
jgi:hypothetical protein